MGLLHSHFSSILSARLLSFPRLLSLSVRLFLSCLVMSWYVCLLVSLSLLAAAGTEALSVRQAAAAAAHVAPVLASTASPVAASSHPRHYRDSVSLGNSPYLQSAALQYDAKFSARCVTLDSLAPLVMDKLDCQASTITLSFSSALTCQQQLARGVELPSSQVPSMAVCSVGEALQAWNEQTVLHGGFAWGCTTPITASNPTPRPTTLMRRITSMLAVNSTSLVVRTAEASPLDCFDELHLSVNMNHTRHNLSPYAMLPKTALTAASSPSGRFHPMATPSMSMVRSSPSPSTAVLIDGQQVTFTWAESGWNNSTALITLTLSNINTFPATVLATWTVPLSNGQLTVTLPTAPSLATLFSSPYQFSWDWSSAGTCGLFGGNCCLGACTWQDAAFTVINGTAGHLALPSTMYDWDCSHCGSTTGAIRPVTYVCDLCQSGYETDLYVDAGCTDCSLQYHYSAYNLTLSLTSAGVTIGIDVNASASVDLDFLLDLQMELNTGNQSNTLLPVSNQLASLPFSIPLFTFTFNLQLGVELNYLTAISSPAAINGGFDATLLFGGAVTYDGGWSSLPRGSLLYNNHGVNATGSTAMEFQIGLLPNLTLGLSSVFTASVGAEVYGEVELGFSFPAYPALPAPYQYNLNTSAPALLHGGDCSVPHFLEYQIAVGVRNNRFDFSIDIDLLVLAFSFFYEIPNVAQLAHFQPLLAGCALSDYNDSLSALGHTGDSTATFTLLFPLSVEVNSSLVQTGLLFDVANALNSPVTRFLIGAVKQVMAPSQTRRLLHSGQQANSVDVVVLPAESGQQSSSAMAEEAQAQQQQPSSPLRTSPTASSMLSNATDSSSSAGVASSTAAALSASSASSASVDSSAPSTATATATPTAAAAAPGSSASSASVPSSPTFSTGAAVVPVGTVAITITVQVNSSTLPATFVESLTIDIATFLAVHNGGNASQYVPFIQLVVSSSSHSRRLLDTSYSVQIVVLGSVASVMNATAAAGGADDATAAFTAVTSLAHVIQAGQFDAVDSGATVPAQPITVDHVQPDGTIAPPSSSSSTGPLGGTGRQSASSSGLSGGAVAGVVVGVVLGVAILVAGLGGGWWYVKSGKRGSS